MYWVKRIVVSLSHVCPGLRASTRDWERHGKISHKANVPQHLTATQELISHGWSLSNGSQRECSGTTRTAIKALLTLGDSYIGSNYSCTYLGMGSSLSHMEAIVLLCCV